MLCWLVDTRSSHMHVSSPCGSPPKKCSSASSSSTNVHIQACDTNHVAMPMPASPSPCSCSHSDSLLAAVAGAKISVVTSLVVSPASACLPWWRNKKLLSITCPKRRTVIPRRGNSCAAEVETAATAQEAGDVLCVETVEPGAALTLRNCSSRINASRSAGVENAKSCA